MLQIGDVIEFRGCIWDDGWEFDAPCVLYRGAKVSGYGGNYGEIENMIESALIDAMISGKPLPSQWSPSDLHEFKCRGWSPRGFARRKAAYHVRVVVRVIPDPDCPGELSWEELARGAKQGPFSAA